MIPMISSKTNFFISSICFIIDFIGIGFSSNRQIIAKLLKFDRLNYRFAFKHLYDNVLPHFVIKKNAPLLLGKWHLLKSDFKAVFVKSSIIAKNFGELINNGSLQHTIKCK